RPRRQQPPRTRTEPVASWTSYIVPLQFRSEAFAKSARRRTLPTMHPASAGPSTCQRSRTAHLDRGDRTQIVAVIDRANENRRLIELGWGFPLVAPRVG